MNRSFVTLILLLFFSSPAVAGDRCDLTNSVGVQNDKSQVLGVKNLIPGFSLVVYTQSCKKSMPGDACTGSFNAGTDISLSQKNELAKILRMPAHLLNFMKKPDVRQPASFSSSDMVGKCL